MADITIVNAANKGQEWKYKSSKKRTVEQILDTIGDGILTDPDNDLMLKEDILELVGTYTWTPKENETTNRQKAFDVAAALEGRFEGQQTAAIENGDQAVAAPQEVLRDMGLPDILLIKEGMTKNNWENVGYDMTFHGRRSLTSSVQAFIENLQERLPNLKEEKCLVYSSVSGSGKTISFLQLKETLKEFAAEKNLNIVVAYLGFNTRLILNEQEKEHIKRGGASDVVARRLVVSTIISLNNPDIVTKLPWELDIYRGFKIPSVAQSKKMLLEYIKKPGSDSPIVIVAGVDEVQRLNRINRDVEGEGLGRHILRILRRWQWEWYNDGLRIVPLGTGITVDWAQESTEGTLWDVQGEDATLISKDDFRKLVQDVVGGKNEEEFERLVPTNTNKATSIELLTAFYWPRVRLLQWWKDDNTELRKTPQKDTQWESWLVWMSHWLRDEYISYKDNSLIPGKDDISGNIHCLFEMKGDDYFTVIPDAYSWPSIIDVFEAKLPVADLYNHLDVVKKMDPREFLTGDCYEFERFGFHVLSLAIHLGLYALGTAKDTKKIQDATATDIQRKRLGLALWFQGQGVVFQNEQNEMLQPVLVGNSTTGSSYGAFYPFAGFHQSSFTENFLEILKKAISSHRPVHVKCGRQTCCDYMYFYVRKKGLRKVEFVCTLVDSKHTAKDKGGGNSQGVTSNDQKGIYDAASKVLSAMNDAELQLVDVRLLILSNRSKVEDTDDDYEQSRALAEAAFQKTLEMKVIRGLDESEIEIGPLADILWARRKVDKKRKLEDL